MKRLVTGLAGLLVTCGAAWLIALPDDPTPPTATLVPVVEDCGVSGSGAFPGGEMFEGSASTVGTVYSVRWEHTAPGITFTTDVTDGVNCFLNGGLIAVVDGFGTGTLNGVPGYIYTIFAEDRRTPPQPAVTLSASRTSPPARFDDGEATFSPARRVTIPATIEVTEGDPGNGWTRLYLGDVRCDYRGDGLAYVFERCPGAPGLAPGATLEVTSARLRIRTPGDDNDDAPVIAVRATIAPETPGSGAPDIYSLTVFDPFGNIIYDFGANIMDGQGDIVTRLL